MKTLKKRIYLMATIAIIGFGTTAFLSSNETNARELGGVKCYCNPGDCVANGSNPNKCNNSSDCNKWDSNCGTDPTQE